MSDQPQNRMVYIDQHGKPQCVSAKAVPAIPSEFGDCLKTLCADMQLALDCIDEFGGVPVPVAKAILRNMEPAHAAIDMAVRCSPAKTAHGVPGDRSSSLGCLEVMN